MKQILLLPTMVLLMLCSCAGVKPPQTHYYLLSPPPDNSAEFATTPIPLQVELAQFLTRGTLVLQLDEQQIRRSHYHRWGAPLPGLIERYIQRRLQQQLTDELGSAPILTLIIDRFHGSQHGQVWLSGQWWINSDTARPHSFNYQTTQHQPGYKGLVITLQQLLNSASKEIVTQLQTKPITTATNGKS
ncbi:MAG: ABC-type transport auxiliary lipoprotein family protein [Thermodesulfobacteriota bacterium]|nr:ABC-type transport auxiliary lipoprotein family protein [Thermodesulfobacteriota bacterium]